MDPLTRDYPAWSPYPFAMNRPIDGVDLDGLEFEWFMNDKFGFPKEFSNFSFPSNFFNQEASPSVDIELHGNVVNMAGAIWENGGLGNVLDKLGNGEIPKYKDGVEALWGILDGPEERARIKRTDAGKMSAVLLFEFAVGTGPRNTVFESKDAFTKELNKDDILLREASKMFYTEMRTGNFKNEDEFLKSLGSTFIAVYSFSPDHTETLKESWEKHIYAWNDNPIAFIIGGMATYVSKEKDSDNLTIKFINPMRRSSLGAHILEDYDKTGPFQTRTQSFEFEISAEEFRSLDPNNDNE